MSAMSSETKHIAVCICTFKRPVFLKRMMREFSGQDTDVLFTYSIVLADNDAMQSAQPVVAEFAESSGVPIRYCVEPRQNIALARNKAIENANGDFVAFIDDDEFPTSRWLLTLFNACNEYGVDGVLGPVKCYFDEQPPQWVSKGNFYERQNYPTGYVINWRNGQTGNILLKSDLFAKCKAPFDPEFRTGEDQIFFQKMIKQGHVFIWCSEAVAYEVVPPERWRRRFMLRRALLRGAMEPKTPTFGARDIAKSVIAVPVYIAVLPIAFVLGHNKFLSILVRLCDHLGKLLALVGINPVREPYVVE